MVVLRLSAVLHVPVPLPHGTGCCWFSRASRAPGNYDSRSCFWCWNPSSLAPDNSTLNSGAGVDAASHLQPLPLTAGKTVWRLLLGIVLWLPNHLHHSTQDVLQLLWYLFILCWQLAGYSWSWRRTPGAPHHLPSSLCTCLLLVTFGPLVIQPLRRGE